MYLSEFLSFDLIFRGVNMQKSQTRPAPPNFQARASYQKPRLEIHRQWKSVIGIGLSIGPLSFPSIPIDSDMDFSLMPVQGGEL
jgi:hypothetical protein